MSLTAAAPNDQITYQVPADTRRYPLDRPPAWSSIMSIAVQNLAPTATLYVTDATGRGIAAPPGAIFTLSFAADRLYGATDVVETPARITVTLYRDAQAPAGNGGRVSGTVNISGTANVAVTGTVTALISGTTNVAIVGTPSVAIAGTPSVNISSTSGNIPVTISGTPSVTVAGTPSVNISSTSGNIPVTISGTPAVTVANSVATTVSSGSVTINNSGPISTIDPNRIWSKIALDNSQINTTLTRMTRQIVVVPILTSLARDGILSIIATDPVANQIPIVIGDEYQGSGVPFILLSMIPYVFDYFFPANTVIAIIFSGIMTVSLGY